MTEARGFEAFTATTGGEEERYILEQRDAFFMAILEELELSDLTQWIRVETRYLGLANNFTEQWLTEDAIHELLFYDEVLGLVLNRRSQSNYHSVTFHKSELGERALESITTIKSMAANIRSRKANPEA